MVRKVSTILAKLLKVETCRNLEYIVQHSSNAILVVLTVNFNLTTQGLGESGTLTIWLGWKWL